MRPSRHPLIYAATLLALAVVYMAPLRYGVALAVLAFLAWWHAEA